MSKIVMLSFIVATITAFSGFAQANQLTGNYISTAWGNVCVNPWGTEQKNLESISSEQLTITARTQWNGGGFFPTLNLSQAGANGWSNATDVSPNDCDRLQRCVYASFRGLSVEGKDLLVVSKCENGVLKTKFKLE